MLGADPAVAVWVGFGSGTTIGRKMVLAKGPGRPWQLGMLCGRAGGQERSAGEAHTDNEDQHFFPENPQPAS